MSVVAVMDATISLSLFKKSRPGLAFRKGNWGGGKGYRKAERCRDVEKGREKRCREEEEGGEKGMVKDGGGEVGEREQVS